MELIKREGWALINKDNRIVVEPFNGQICIYPSRELAKKLGLNDNFDLEIRKVNIETIGE